MDIYLLRHGIAAERDPNAWPDDSQRPLTEFGRKRMRRIAKGMKKLDISFDLLLSSPYTRARETADIVAARFGLDVVESEALTPDGSFEKLVALLQDLNPAPQSVLLVGHEPDLGETVCRLTSGQAGRWVTMRKGGLARVDVEQLDLMRPRACLEWLLTPRLLRAL